MIEVYYQRLFINALLYIKDDKILWSDYVSVKTFQRMNSPKIFEKLFKVKLFEIAE